MSTAITTRGGNLVVVKEWFEQKPLSAYKGYSKIHESPRLRVGGRILPGETRRQAGYVVNPNGTKVWRDGYISYSCRVWHRKLVREVVESTGEIFTSDIEVPAFHIFDILSEYREIVEAETTKIVGTSPSIFEDIKGIEPLKPSKTNKKPKGKDKKELFAFEKART